MHSAPLLRQTAATAAANEGGGRGLPLGGLEVHAYLQCGVSRLRRLLAGDGGDGVVLLVELLHEIKAESGGGGQGGNGEIMRCRCEVSH